MVSVNTLIVIVCFAQCVLHEWYSTPFFFFFFFLLRPRCLAESWTWAFWLQKNMPKFTKIPFFLQPHPSTGIKPIKKWVLLASPGSAFGADSYFLYPLHTPPPPPPPTPPVLLQQHVNDPSHSAKECRWQVTAKRTCTQRLWLWIKWHCKLVHRCTHMTCAKVAAVSHGTSHVSGN